ncbi:hypothetical protein Fuma_04237 [Fuerstiella marisgermanici]|uniref:Uncharacterized protein n=1 Tax=Fuerstiella marisgermanici TaxID=1891926 RepID=A0A1P8WKM1_9PLAN|nr:hypothetical protein Fuma_04237 [Fuerstiella marisgermanici]
MTCNSGLLTHVACAVVMHFVPPDVKLSSTIEKGVAEILRIRKLPAWCWHKATIRSIFMPNCNIAVLPKHTTRDADLALADALTPKLNKLRL